MLLILLKNKGVITMNKTNKITVCVEGKNIKVEGIVTNIKKEFIIYHMVHVQNYFHTFLYIFIYV